jgi:hypothetical protein
LLTPLPFTLRKANAARENDQGRESPAAGRGKVCFTPVNFLICFQRTEKPIGPRFTRRAISGSLRASGFAAQRQGTDSRQVAVAIQTGIKQLADDLAVRQSGDFGNVVKLRPFLLRQADDFHAQTAGVGDLCEVCATHAANDGPGSARTASRFS